MHCGKRPDAESMYKIGKNSDYFKYIFAFDLLETKDYLYIDVGKDLSAFLLRVDKQSGDILSLELEGEIVEGFMTKYRKVDVPPLYQRPVRRPSLLLHQHDRPAMDLRL